RLPGCHVLSAAAFDRPPNVRLNCAAGSFLDRGERWHATRMKNAPGYGPRQRRQLQGVLGGGLTGTQQIWL
ncbi:MAG: hypothetical protein WCH86_09385, partial [Kiritimatiellales bacterium]